MCFSIAVAAVIAAAAWSALALARSVWMWPVAGAWVAAGAGALGPDVVAGWCVGGGWRWRARSGRGCWLARGRRLAGPAAPFMRHNLA